MPLDVAVELAPEISPDEPIRDRVLLRLKVTNRGRDEVVVVAPDAAAALNLVVFDRRWNLVQPQAAGKVNVARQEVAIGPGESTQFDMEGLAYTSGTARMVYDLDPGRYRVLAVYHPHDPRDEQDVESPAPAASNVLTLEIA